LPPVLLGPSGHPISSYKKADPPKLGPAFGDWAGRDVIFNQMPGGAILQFDLSRLTLADFRAMRDHPQINASLAVLTFMMHGLDWWIECDRQEIADQIESNLRDTWTRLIRALSQSYWAGYSPIALEYENDTQAGKVVVNKFKDLIPEECRVNWKLVEGYAAEGRVTPKFKEYDGIKQQGTQQPIPVENSLWYLLLMENGDFYGRKLLKPAFAPWYFSILIHLFANRYYERFGEPTPVGRAPFDDDLETIDDSGNPKLVGGKEAMENILRSLRSRGTVVLPNNIQPGSRVSGDKTAYEYDIEYLESQMRGADFEKYMSRLDEEMSLGIFTPVLLFRTADVGSYNLGVGHMQVFLWMLNALAGDLKEYIDKFVVKRLKDYNYGPNAPEAHWNFRRMGKENADLIRVLLQALVADDKVMPDLDQLGMMAGLDLKQIRQVTQPPPDPNNPPNPTDPNQPKPKSTGPKGVGQPRATAKEIANRIQRQVERAWRDGTFGPGFTPSMGYQRRFEGALLVEGVSEPEAARLTEKLYTRVGGWMSDAIALGAKEYSGPQHFMKMLETVLDSEVESLVPQDA